MGLKEWRKKKWFKIMTNTYILVLTIFVIWMAFFDTNSLLIHLELESEIDKLEKEKEFLKSEIAKDKEILKKMSNEKELEKDNEEIFLIEYEDSIKQKNDE